MQQNGNTKSFINETSQLFWLPIGPFRVSTESMKVHNSNVIDEFPCLYIGNNVDFVLNTWKIIDHLSIDLCQMLQNNRVIHDMIPEICISTTYPKSIFCKTGIVDYVFEMVL